MAFHAKIV